MQLAIHAVLLSILLLVPSATFVHSEADGEYRASITSVQTRNDGGELIGSGSAGERILIESAISLNDVPGHDYVQKYTYYAQIKVSEKNPYVEYVAVHEGVLEGDGAETAWVFWTPERAGLYYVETYVWDGMTALTSPGPVSLILVN